MKDLTEYIIPIAGIKVGRKEYNYKIGKKFFDAFEYSEIKDGNLNVVLTIEKSETMIVSNFKIEGEIIAECDMCLSNVSLPINGEYRQIFKFSDEEDLKLDDEITFVKSTEFEIDVAPFIIEFANLSKPNKINHKKGNCDETFTSALDEYLLVEEVEEKENIEKEKDEAEIDPRWNALIKLKNKQ